MAYAEEGRPCPPIDEHVTPVALLFPRSFVEAVEAMPGEKVHDYCFMGSLYRQETFAHRDWVLDFAARRFTDRSYLHLSEAPPSHVRLGPYDHTGDHEEVWVPKDVPWGERAHFNPHYFRVLRRSELTLCPAGDLPWSLRFFEAIMCRSIPVVSDPAHTGRNDLERSLGYHVLLRDEPHRYDPDLAEENHRRFLDHQTLLGRRGTS
jgi:hypothetical protein